MASIVQISDLHLLADEVNQAAIFDALVKVLGAHFADVGKAADLLVITGDVFDSSTLPVARALPVFETLYEKLIAALGGKAPTIIIPGNHDRRVKGLLGPHRNGLFQALADTFARRAERGGPHVYVHGTEVPFLARVVPPEVHGLPISIVAYDSTHLPRGLLSAGGVLLQEDLLRAARDLENTPLDRPVLFLLHHHLVPTPLTDVGAIDLSSTAAILKWLVQKILPGLIANGDREELTMTALGSGTALSTLHAFGRATLVLHGHKHYANARMLRGVLQDQGDVLIVSAGSAGTAEPWTPTAGHAARLWPSFNLLELTDGLLHAQTVSFGYKGSSAGKSSSRSLLRAQQRGEAWAVEPVPLEPEVVVGPRLTVNHSDIKLSPSALLPRWDYVCTRRIEKAGESPSRYLETVEGAPLARVVIGDRSMAVPASLELDTAGETTYRLDGGVCRTVAEGRRVYGATASPYEWVGVMNRYACDDVRLTVEGLDDLGVDAFGSLTDLGTGVERPVRLTRGARLEARIPDCPARALLRIYWPLVR